MNAVKSSSDGEICGDGLSFHHLIVPFSSLENLEYDRRDPLRWPRGTRYLQKLALTSPISSCRSVGIVHSQTQAMEFSCSFFYGTLLPSRPLVSILSDRGTDILDKVGYQLYFCMSDHR
jgi:hypothetical protein